MHGAAQRFFSTLRRAASAVVLGLLVACAVEAPPSAPPGVTVVTLAERQFDDAPAQRVALPDWPLDPPLQPAPKSVRYRVALPRPDALPAEPAVLMQGLLVNASLSFNGHLLAAPVHEDGAILPRGLDRLVLLSLPRGLWRAEGNEIQIVARAQNRMSVSRLELGELGALAERHRRMVLTMFVGPMVVGAVVGTLGLVMLALWIRLREMPFLLFALGAVASWLTNWMPLLSWPAIGGVGYAIVWISLFGVVVAAFAAFCLRLAGWHRPRLERALLCLAASGPFVLGGAYAVGQMDVASTLWRLMLIVGIGLALTAVCRAAWAYRTGASVAMVLCGVVAGALGVHDWLLDLEETLNNPALLTPYAGLVFAATATGILIERYVAAARLSATLNRELEQRVEAQGAQLRRTLADAQAARDAAQAADRAKSNFLAVASHDLRQPAHALGLYLSALPDEGLSAEQQEILGRLRDSHHALERMFEALLDISRMDAGSVKPQLEAVSPRAVLQALADEAAPAADAKGLRLVLRVAAGAAAVRVSTDVLLFERMLRNLIGNAVKYTASGGVLLACRVRHEGAGPVVRIEVWDTGPGIAADQREHVFEEFYQLAPAGAGRRASDGLGLGLAIVRRLARLLGVQVALRSRVGRGSCFSLALPVVAEQGRATSAAPAERDLQGLRVGVIEDEPAVRDAMGRLLTRWGCHVVAGADAAGLLGAMPGPPMPLDALIVDYSLAGTTTGPDEATRLAATVGWAAPVLVITGEQSPERLRVLAALGLPWLSKPVAPQALRAALHELLAARPAPRALGADHA